MANKITSTKTLGIVLLICALLLLIRIPIISSLLNITQLVAIVIAIIGVLLIIK